MKTDMMEIVIFNVLDYFGEVYVYFSQHIIAW